MDWSLKTEPFDTLEPSGLTPEISAIPVMRNEVNHFEWSNPVLYLMMAIIIIPTVFSWYYGQAYVEKVSKAKSKKAKQW
jgi:hypothetical protein